MMSKSSSRHSLRPVAVCALALLLALLQAGCTHSRPQRPSGPELALASSTRPQPIVAWMPRRGCCPAALHNVVTELRRRLESQARLRTIVSDSPRSVEQSAPSGRQPDAAGQLRRARDLYLRLQTDDLQRELDGMLQRAEKSGGRDVTPQQLGTAHLYLAALAHARKDPAALVAQAQAAIALVPELQPDADIFPPAVQRAIDEARSNRQVVELEVISDPPGAHVTLNGLGRGHTPVTLAEASVGRHYLRVEHDLCRPWRQRIDLRSSTALKLSLRPRQPVEIGEVLLEQPRLAGSGLDLLGVHALVSVDAVPRALRVRIVGRSGPPRELSLTPASPSSAFESVTRVATATSAAHPQPSTSPTPRAGATQPSHWRRYWWAWALGAASLAAVGVAVPLALSLSDSDSGREVLLEPVP